MRRWRCVLTRRFGPPRRPGGTAAGSRRGKSGSRSRRFLVTTSSSARSLTSPRGNVITERLDIEVINQKVEVVFKDIKNLHLAVYPPKGRVRVAAPLRLDVQAIRLAVISRLGWIRRQQARLQVQERQSEREFVTGESHYFQGRRYRMRVIESDIQLIRRSGNTT